MANDDLTLVYTILCDDVRLEAGNKLSLMGVFQNMMVERAPVSLIKMAIVQHWRGAGEYTAEVRILSPDKRQVVMASQPTPIVLQTGGFADNVSFFVNAAFPVVGTYKVQTLINANLFNEFDLIVSEPSGTADDVEFPDIVRDE